MYAVIETGGKQYRVEVGTELEVELLDAQPGNTVTLDRVLLVADGDEASIGRPLVPNATVSAEVLRQDRGEKVIAFKYRPKARRRVKKGHRQELTVLRISDITLDGKSAAAAARKAEDDAKTERMRLEEAAAKQAAADAELAKKLAKAEAAGAPAESTSKPRAKATKPAAADAPEAEAEDVPKARSTKAKASAGDAAETAAADDTDTPKPSRAKAEPAAADAETEEKPKRARATKKDE